jgi:hypothetical protein
MNKVLIKTLCTRCLEPLVCEWPEEMNWGGNTVTAHEYMANAMNSEDVKICCDDCLDTMPDVDLDKMEVMYI